MNLRKSNCLDYNLFILFKRGLKRTKKGEIVRKQVRENRCVEKKTMKDIEKN